ncbi:hypothetical protein [Streptomyces sp. NPDC002540]
MSSSPAISADVVAWPEGKAKPEACVAQSPSGGAGPGDHPHEAVADALPEQQEGQCPHHVSQPSTRVTARDQPGRHRRGVREHPGAGGRDGPSGRHEARRPVPQRPVVGGPVQGRWGAVPGGQDENRQPDQSEQPHQRGQQRSAER